MVEVKPNPTFTVVDKIAARGYEPRSFGTDAGALPEPPPFEARSAALFLDLDGTIAGVADTPSEVQPDARRTRLIRRLAASLDGRLAILSERTLEDVDRILEGAVERVAAVHGLVRREGGVEHRAPGDRVGLDRARRSLARLPLVYDGVLIEDKALSLAVHYRRAMRWEAPVRAHVGEVSRQTGLELHQGSCVMEITSAGPTKADALRAFMRAGRLRGARPIMVGGDVTDEGAFRAAAALGGYGVLVGAPRPTSAHYRLSGVDAVLDWLGGACAAA
jgi:trehalose 6-phosphate phosphatase